MSNSPPWTHPRHTREGTKCGDSYLSEAGHLCRIPGPEIRRPPAPEDRAMVYLEREKMPVTLGVTITPEVQRIIDALYRCKNEPCGLRFSGMSCPVCHTPRDLDLSDICGQLSPFIQKIYDNEAALVALAGSLPSDARIRHVGFQTERCVISFDDQCGSTEEIVLSIDELQEWLDSLGAPDGD